MTVFHSVLTQAFLSLIFPVLTKPVHLPEGLLILVTRVDVFMGLFSQRIIPSDANIPLEVWRISVLELLNCSQRTEPQGIQPWDDLNSALFLHVQSFSLKMLWWQNPPMTLYETVSNQCMNPILNVPFSSLFGGCRNIVYFITKKESHCIMSTSESLALPFHGNKLLGVFT
jgi:hypothetical protein